MTFHLIRPLLFSYASLNLKLQINPDYQYMILKFSIRALIVLACTSAFSQPNFDYTLSGNLSHPVCEAIGTRQISPLSPVCTPEIPSRNEKEIHRTVLPIPDKQHVELLDR